MGIGVSYTGYDGKTRNSVAQNAADLPRIMGETRRQTAPAAKVPKVGDTLRPSLDPVDGPLVGIEGNESSQPDGQFRAVGTKGGWRLPFSRTEVEVKPSVIMGCNEVTLTKLQYDVIFSESGLAKGRTEERVVWRKSFFVLAEASGGGGEYEVRPKWTYLPGDENTPRLSALLFGKGSSLKGDIEEVERREGVTKVDVYTHGELT